MCVKILVGNAICLWSKKTWYSDLVAGLKQKKMVNKPDCNYINVSYENI